MPILGLTGNDDYPTADTGNAQSGLYSQNTQGLENYTQTESGTIAGTAISTGPTIGQQMLGDMQAG